LEEIESSWDSGEHERAHANPGEVDAGSAGRFGVAADRVDVAAEAGPVEQQGVADEHAQDDRHHPWHALERHQQTTVVVAHQDEDNAGNGHREDLDRGECHRRSDQSALPSAQVT
jgi:hypothetical protein